MNPASEGQEDETYEAIVPGEYRSLVQMTSLT